MKIHVLRSEILVPRDREEVFAYFDRPENLSAITPPELGFKLLTPSPLMRNGTVIDYRIRLCGMPMRWTSVINDYKPPHRFIDIQLKGPYAFWHHEHLFEVVPGGTRILDEVRYVLPFGWIGDVAHRLWVRRMLERIFEYRRARVVERFGRMGGSA